ncbi:Prostaglandin E synthase 3 (Cytosolic) [Mortierella sp. AD032]|nr:Prostaglandin E synthase 3 (Cytosolic) [Mortierella sp. AD032]
MSTATLTPEVLWAQRANLVYVTVSLADTTPTITLTENKLEVTATSAGKDYAVSFEFNQPIVPETSITKATARNIFFTINKKDEAWWPRLNKGSKLNFIKTDFARWRDEDDEEDEPEQNEAMDMGGMGGMPGMGGMGGMPGMGGMGGMPGMGGMGGMGGMDLQSLMASMGQGGSMPDMGEYDDQDESGDDEDDIPPLEHEDEKN